MLFCSTAGGLAGTTDASAMTASVMAESVLTVFAPQLAGMYTGGAFSDDRQPDPQSALFHLEVGMRLPTVFHSLTLVGPLPPRGRSFRHPSFKKLNYCTEQAAC
jgi:hypothetical protein